MVKSIDLVALRFAAFNDATAKLAYGSLSSIAILLKNSLQVICVAFYCRNMVLQKMRSSPSVTGTFGNGV